MISLVYLGIRLKEQLESNPDGLSGVDVLWQGPDVKALAAARLTNVGVLVVELEALGEEPVAQLDTLRRRLSPELTLVLHHFAKRDLLSSVLDDSTRTLQAPVSLASLRSQMLSLIVRDMLAPISTTAVPSRTAAGPSSPALVPSAFGAKTCPKCGATIS